MQLTARSTRAGSVYFLRLFWNLESGRILILARGLSYKNDGVEHRFLLGLKISGLVPLRVLKSNMTTVRAIPIPFRVFRSGMEKKVNWSVSR